MNLKFIESGKLTGTFGDLIVSIPLHPLCWGCRCMSPHEAVFFMCFGTRHPVPHACTADTLLTLSRPPIFAFFNSNRTINFTILQEMRILRVWSEPGILSPANLHQASCFDESSMALQRMSASVICVYFLPHCTTCK